MLSSLTSGYGDVSRVCTLFAVSGWYASNKFTGRPKRYAHINNLMASVSCFGQDPRDSTVGASENPPVTTYPVNNNPLTWASLATHSSPSIKLSRLSDPGFCTNWYKVPSSPAGQKFAGRMSATVQLVKTFNERFRRCSTFSFLRRRSVMFILLFGSMLPFVLAHSTASLNLQFMQVVTSLPAAK